MRQPTRFTPTRMAEAIVRGIAATYSADAAKSKFFELGDLFQEIGMTLECNSDGDPIDYDYANPRLVTDIRILRGMCDVIDNAAIEMMSTDPPKFVPDMIS